MRISKIIYISILLAIVTIMCNSCTCYAAPTDGGSDTSGEVGGSSEIGLPTLDETYRPVVGEGRATNIVVSILNVLTAVGVVAIVIAVTLIGFGSILGSASEKALGQEKMVGIIIAAVLMIGGSIIVKLIISVAESI